MKKSILFFVALFFTISISAQMQNLYELSQGKMVYSKILFDNDNLWGYFYLYEIDQQKDSTKMEYFVLDKNLNKIYNGSFFEKKYSTNVFVSYYNRYLNCAFVGGRLVMDIALYSSNGKMVYNSNRIISFEDNTVSDELIFQDYAFKPLPAKVLTVKSRVDSINNKIFVDPIHGDGKHGFIVRSFNEYESKNEKAIKFYNKDREYCWDFVFDSIPRKMKLYMNPNHTTYNYLYMDSLRIYGLKNTYVNKVLNTLQLVSTDLKTGKVLFNYQIQTDSSRYFHQINTKQLGDTIAIYGRFYNNKKFAKGTYYQGYYRILIDKNGKELDRKYKLWTEMSTPDVALTKKCLINKSQNTLYNNSLIMLRDGSLVSCNQEMNTRSIVATVLYIFSISYISLDKEYLDDIYFIRFDKQFKPIGIDKVELSKSTDIRIGIDDFLFSQYHKGNKEAVVCYTNKVKTGFKSEIELVINSIKNNQLLTERIPLTSSKKYAIYPRPAKDGYIMLNEYNEKNEYNQLRLEKLNN